MRFSLTILATCLMLFGAGGTLGKPISNASGASNADLLARGEPIKRPARLYDPSKTHSIAARASSVPTTTSTAVAIVTSHTPTAKRDLHLEEERGVSPINYVYFDTSNGNVEVSSTYSTSYIFNNPSMDRDTISAVIPPAGGSTSTTDSYFFIGGNYMSNQADSSAFGYIYLGAFNNFGGDGLDYSYAQTGIWSYPASGEPASLEYKDTSGNIIHLNIYQGSDSKIYGALAASDISASGVTVTEEDRIDITFTV